MLDHNKVLTVDIPNDANKRERFNIPSNMFVIFKDFVSNCKIIGHRISIVLALLSTSATAVLAASTETLFDLIPQFALTEAKKTLPVFRSQHFEPGSGCLLDYNLSSGKVQTNWQEVSDRRTLINLFRESVDNVTTWWANPSLCSNMSRVESGPAWVKLSVRGPTDVAQALTIMPDRLIMRQRSIEHFTRLYGGTFFRSRGRFANGGFNMMNFYAGMRINADKRVTLSDYASLILTVDASLDAANVMTGCVSGTPPQGAMNCYHPRRMATQFRIAFGNLIWRDPRCRQRDDADPVCQYQGRYMQTSLSLHDERIQFHNEDFHIQRGSAQSKSAIIPIFRIDLRRLLPPGTTSNPFHVVGKRAMAQGDILPAFKHGILLAEKEGHLPPRLTKADGSKETDNEYFSHYSLGSVNIGYEVSGLSDMTYSIYHFSLRGTPKQ